MRGEFPRPSLGLRFRPSIYPLHGHLMTRDTPDPIDADISTEEQFETTLHPLVFNATRNDVDLHGAWEFRNGDRAPDWEVLITELAKESSTD